MSIQGVSWGLAPGHAWQGHWKAKARRPLRGSGRGESTVRGVSGVWHRNTPLRALARADAEADQPRERGDRPQRQRGASAGLLGLLRAQRRAADESAAEALDRLRR